MENQDLIEVSDKKKKEPLMQQIHAAHMQPPKDTGARRLNVCRPLSFSKRNLNISRQSFASEIPESDFIKFPNVTVFIHSLAYLSIACLVYAALAFYVLNAFLNIQESLRSTKPSGDFVNENDSRKSGSYSSNFKLCNAGVALTSYALTASFCCFMISSMQNVFASKIMKMNEGEERVYKYLEECSSTRILAIAGFFLCIPISFIDMAIFLSLRSPSENNIVGVVLLALGAVVSTVGGAHSCYHWREEKIRAQTGMPVYDSRFSVPANLASYATPCHHLV